MFLLRSFEFIQSVEIKKRKSKHQIDLMKMRYCKQVVDSCVMSYDQ